MNIRDLAAKPRVLIGCATIISCGLLANAQERSIAVRYGGVNPSEFVQVLTDDHWVIDSCATEMIEQYVARELFLGHKEGTVTLDIVSAGELGFKNYVTYDQICKRAAARNLGLCNPIDAAEFCLAFDEHEITGQSLIVVIEPIKWRDGKDYVFLCKCRDARRRVLIGWQVRPNKTDNMFAPGAKFVFKRLSR